MAAAATGEEEVEADGAAAAGNGKGLTREGKSFDVMCSVSVMDGRE